MDIMDCNNSLENKKNNLYENWICVDLNEQDNEDIYFKEKSITPRNTESGTNKLHVTKKKRVRINTENENREWLLWGEKILVIEENIGGVRHCYQEDRISLGDLYITNYQIRFEFQSIKKKKKNLVLSVPVTTVLTIEAKTPQEVEYSNISSCTGFIIVSCKDMQQLEFAFFKEQQASRVYSLLVRYCTPRSLQHVFAFDHRKGQGKEKGTWTEEQIAAGWNVYDVQKEFMRQKVNLNNIKWKQTDINKNFEICDSYPQILIVPAAATDDLLREAAAFRSRGRLPVLTWHHPYNGASLTRCSQPLVGLSRSRSKADEELVEIIRKTSNSNQIYIIDARPKANAIANTVFGKGYEITTYYNNCTLHFMNIENIHAMSDSYYRLSKACQKHGDPYWLSNLEATGWLKHIQLILFGAYFIVKLIEKEGAPVICRCSDGWDRTAQLCSLSQLMMDPYYRTIEGFQVLIEKDWISFGFRFADRCGHLKNNDGEYSPVFIQFIDCVWQIWQQYPRQFEFNEKFLLCILEHVYSCRFGNFLYNDMKTRIEREVKTRTVSLWTLINTNLNMYKNKFYKPPNPKSKQRVLQPDYSIKKLSIQFWTAYYFKDSHMKSEYQLMIQSALLSLAEENEQMKQDLENEAKERQMLERELFEIKEKMKEYKKVVKENGLSPVLVDDSNSDDGVLLTKLNLSKDEDGISKQKKQESDIEKMKQTMISVSVPPREVKVLDDYFK